MDGMVLSVIMSGSSLRCREALRGLDMRTSGRANDGPLTYIPLLAGVILILALIGGPTPLLRSIDQFVRGLLETFVSALAAARHLLG